MTHETVERLNADCFCITVDPSRLRLELESDQATRGLYDSLRSTHAYLFARSPIFLSRDTVRAMQALIDAVETVAALQAYREAVLAWAPPIARFEPSAAGVLMGYDFHVTPRGPRLIEINTNAGGAFLNAVLARAQQACCAPVLSLLATPGEATTLQAALLEMFVAEWHRERGTVPLRRVAIVDESPERQYLYPEFLLAAHAERLWKARRGLFFKPVAGYGGKAAYRGDKITRTVWASILAGDYVAQELVPPSERSVRVDDRPVKLKLDVRCYACAGKVVTLAARLYQGQVTNFRTPGGGFATVFCPST